MCVCVWVWVLLPAWLHKGVVLLSHFAGEGLAAVRRGAVGVDQVSSWRPTTNNPSITARRHGSGRGGCARTRLWLHIWSRSEEAVWKCDPVKATWINLPIKSHNVWELDVNGVSQSPQTSGFHLRLKRYSVNCHRWTYSHSRSWNLEFKTIYGLWVII